MQRWITNTLQWKEVHTMVADEKLEPSYRAQESTAHRKVSLDERQALILTR